MKGLLDSVDHLPGGSVKTAVAKLASGGCECSPFPADILNRTREDIRISLKKSGFGDGLPQSGDVQQKTEVRLLQALLEAFQDPDAYFCEWWARGVWIGSKEKKLPRAPALYERKTKWPTYGAEEVALHGDWRTNYGSLREHEAQVLKQFAEEIEEDLMIVTTLEEAMDAYGDELLIAATGAIAKKGQGPGGEVRVIFDGTRGVMLNLGIKIRDQVRFPTAPDVKAVLAELAEEGGSYLMLLYDIKKAHRRIPVRRQDWGRQACQVRGSAAASAQCRRESRKRATGEEPRDGKALFQKLLKGDFTDAELKEKVYLNCVGTFGVT